MTKISLVYQIKSYISFVRWLVFIAENFSMYTFFSMLLSRDMSWKVYIEKSCDEDKSTAQRDIHRQRIPCKSSLEELYVIYISSVMSKIGL